MNQVALYALAFSCDEVFFIIQGWADIDERTELKYWLSTLGNIPGPLSAGE
jgi:hypothetical protein